MKSNIIYIAMYNPMIYESSYGILSVHKTQKGAEMAIEFDKEERRKEWMGIYSTKEEQDLNPFGKFESWAVRVDKLME